MNHNFCYNYGFLADWFKENPKIQRNDVLDKMEMGDYNTLHNWTTGKTMMTLTQMMKFCNRFNVPITAFFYDECADESSIFTPLNINAMIEPSGGWPDASRKAGMKVCDPRTDSHTHSNIPEYIRVATGVSANNEDYKQEEEQTVQASDLTPSERMRFLDIIERMQKDIMELNKKTIEQAHLLAEKDARINAMVQDRPYQVIKQYEPNYAPNLQVAENDG